MTEYYYRMYDQLTGDGHSTWPKIYVVKLKVVKHTPCGVRVIGGLGNNSGPNGRFINNSHRKRFGYPTIEEAKESFIARKRRQIRIYDNRVKTAEQCIEKINHDDFKILGDWLHD